MTDVDLVTEDVREDDLRYISDIATVMSAINTTVIEICLTSSFGIRRDYRLHDDLRHVTPHLKHAPHL